MNNSWAVVEFVNSKEVEVVPVKWVSKNPNNGDMECWFPSKKLNISNLVSKCAEVGEVGLWDIYEVRVLGDNYFSLEVARKKLKIAEETSDLESEPSKKRKIISKSLFSPSPTKQHNVGRKRKLVSPSTSGSDNEDLSLPNFDDFVNKASSKSPNKTNSSVVESSEYHIESEFTQPTEVTPISSTRKTGSDREKLRPNSGILLKNTSTKFQNGTNSSVRKLPDLSSSLKVTPDASSTEKEATDSAWKVGVTRTLNYLKLKVDAVFEKLDEVLDVVQHLPQTNDKTSDDVIDDDFYQKSADALDLTAFPLNNLDELNKVEDELRNKVTFDNLVKKTSSIGGVNTKETTKRILRFLLSDAVAMHFSYHGFKRKRVFSDLKIKEVVFKSVRHSKNSRESTDSEIESVIKDWLRHAKFRFQNKKSKDTALEIAE